MEGRFVVDGAESELGILDLIQVCNLRLCGACAEAGVGE